MPILTKYKLIKGYLYTNDNFKDRTRFEPCSCPHMGRRVLSSTKTEQYGCVGDDCGHRVKCGGCCPFFQIEREAGKYYALLNCIDGNILKLELISIEF